MGKSHSKTEKVPAFTINEKTPVSPRQKLKERKKQKKFGLVKSKSKLEGSQQPRPPMVPDLSDMISETDFEEEIKRRMQDQLAFNSDIFVLNQMMMSVQFFANYERFVAMLRLVHEPISTTLLIKTFREHFNNI